MKSQFFRILIAISALLYCNGVSKNQESSWSNGDFDDIKTYPGSHKISRCPHQPHQECPKYELLDPRNIESTRREMEECTKLSISCQFAKNSKFRTIDGSCNNLKHPSWGMSNTCLTRLLPFDYADRISHPRESCTGRPLPNPRHISNVFHRERKPEIYDKFTTHFMEWGQLLAHDLSLNNIRRSPESGYNLPIHCCSNGPVINDTCFCFPVPPSDPFFLKFGQTSIGVSRTLPCPYCLGGQRAHLNENTAYHDLSLLYGSTDAKAQSLRSRSRGMLKAEFNGKHGPLLPRVSIEEECESPPHQKKCYHSGDSRCDGTLFLLTVHTYLHRHHNFICNQLHKINPHWKDERLYQEARRINIAIAQCTTYRDYLPNILGEIMIKKGLAVLPSDECTKYNPDLDPSVTDEFSAWAGRYGHSQIPGRVSEIDPKTGKTDSIMLRDYFFRPFGFRRGQFDKIAKGMSVDKLAKRDPFLSDDVRNYLFRRVYLNETTGIDLAFLSIVRGRDHGLPGYTYYVSYLLSKTVHAFADLKEILPDKSVELLEKLYESVHDIDAYTAGLAEPNVPGGLVGPTIGAVLGIQYTRTKFGDRYWFEHENEAGSFTKGQLLEIKRSSLSRILCETTAITEIQANVFLPPSSENPIVSCENIHKFNFLLWKE